MSSYRLRADGPEDAEFRATFRAWLGRELPAEYCFYGERPPNEVVVDWHKRLYRGGYVAPHWPRSTAAASCRSPCRPSSARSWPMPARPS